MPSFTAVVDDVDVPLMVVKDVFAVVMTLQESYGVAAGLMVARGEGGSIVIVSSPRAFMPHPGSMAYNMAKAAVDQMIRTAATELTGERIRVNGIHPGWIDTPGERKFLSEAALKDSLGRLDASRVTGLLLNKVEGQSLEYGYGAYG